MAPVAKLFKQRKEKRTHLKSFSAANREMNTVSYPFAYENPQHQSCINLTARNEVQIQHFLNFQDDNITSVICASSELIVLSIFALQFHLRIDIKELSFTNSKSGTDLPMESYGHFIK